MAAKQPSQPPPARECGWCWSLFKIFCYVSVAFQAEIGGWWQSAHRLEDTCKYPPLPANQSGVKVMVAGFAKMGTRTVSRTLYELGLERSYHGEEFLLHVWSPIVTKYWRQPEHGGYRNVPVSVPWAPSNNSLLALEATPLQVLADNISRCRVDAVAFDGVEKLFWPVYAVSPGAKVLVMNWRTFEEADKSMDNFITLFLPWLVFFGHVYGCAHVLPWGIVVAYVLEPLFGHPARQFKEEGAPLINQVQSPYTLMYLRMAGTVEMVSHWFDGLCLWEDITQERHTEFFEIIKYVVPAENRMDVDPRKHTYEDICRFLGLKECRRKGKLPRAINLGNHEIDFFPACAMLMPIWMFLHWVNYQVFKQLWALAARAILACTGLLRRGQHSKAE